MIPTDLSGSSAPLADARIDWGQGRLIGFSVPPEDGNSFDVVQLVLDGHCILTAVANRSIFDLARDLAGMRLPAREQSAFELRIPQGSLLPGHLSEAGVRLEIRTAQGRPIYDYLIKGPHELLRLTEGAPADLMFEVQFRHLQDGAVHGIVRDRYCTGVRPVLQVRLNEHPPEPLAIYESSGDGRVHHFAVNLRADHLSSGSNHLHVISPSGVPMASYPIQMGSTQLGETDRRVSVLEAEVAFLKHLVLNQNNEALPARLALLKGEIVNICSDMLSLQRTNLEREIFGTRGLAPAGPASSPPRELGTSPSAMSAGAPLTAPTPPAATA